jgi:hypothetical protein
LTLRSAVLTNPRADKERVQSLITKEEFHGNSVLWRVKPLITGVSVVVASIASAIWRHPITWNPKPGFWRNPMWLVVLALLVLSAYMFSFVFRGERRQELSALDAVFNGDPNTSGPSPSNATHRLPCDWFGVQGALPGTLYVVPDGLVFRLRSPTAQDEIRMGPARTITLNTFDVPVKSWARWLGYRVPLLLIEWSDDERAVFKLPSPDTTVSRLQDCIDKLRLAGA